MLEREAGLEISRATLDTWVMRVGELLQPVVSAMRRHLRADYLQADETIVTVQMQDKRGADHPAHLGQYGRPGVKRFSIFSSVAIARGREVPRSVGRHFADGRLFGLPSRGRA